MFRDGDSDSELSVNYQETEPDRDTGIDKGMFASFTDIATSDNRGTIPE
jgi:hypothetical protein